MEGQLNCPLCKVLYQESNMPRLLTMCGHTFCEKCIKSIISKKKDGKYKITCPEDGSSLDLLNGRTTQFPKNIALLDAASSRKKRRSKTEMPTILNPNGIDYSMIKESDDAYEATSDIDVSGN